MPFFDFTSKIVTQSRLRLLMAAQGRMESIESAQDRWKSFDVATKDARGCLSAIGLFTVA